VDTRHGLADVDWISASVDAAADLTVRHLADRDGLSASASLVLNRIDREGPTRLTVLAAAEGISQPAMTQLVQRLERQGFLTRLCDPDDGRAALVAITESGRTLLARRTLGRHERLADLLATLSSEEELTLRLAAKVALPILQRLLETAADAPPRVTDPKKSGLELGPTT
jgi:DNA-binding MarR family transcriptional regulator